MDKKPRKKKRDYDRSITAFRVVQEAIEKTEGTEPQPEPPTIEGKNPNAVALGQKGGQARAKRLTPEQRKEIAKRAAEARWGKQG